MNKDQILNNWWNKVKDVSPEVVVNDMQKLWTKFKSSEQLKGVWDKITAMYALVKDVVKGDYPEFPKSKLAFIVGALAYLILTLDLVPDFIPVVGLLDDIVVLTWVFMQCKTELARYMEKKEPSTNAPTPTASLTNETPCNG